MSGSIAETGRPGLTLLSSRSPEVYVRHPDTREAYPLTLSELMFRVEHSLDVEVDRAWIPLIVAMADGLFMHRRGALWRARAGRGFAEPALSPGRVEVSDDHPDALLAAGILEAFTIEEIFHRGEWASLERPRTWELNGWWEQLYGVIPMPPAFDDDDEDDDDPPHLSVGVRSHPYGLQSADNQVRHLLERGLLTQDSLLMRLRVSIHEQGRALAALRDGWRIDAEGTLQLPPRGSHSPGDMAERARRLARTPRRHRLFDLTALGQLAKLGLAEERGGSFFG